MAEIITKDIKFEEDIVIVNGDFLLFNSDEVHIENILKANKGFFFENPLVGLGIIRELNGSKTIQELKQDIRRQLVLDNFSVQLVEIKEGEININAKRLK
ncbi:hypothetical protein pippi81_gp044 [Flavobacterium phage vB_FspM_pippi8-1]|uniref:Uncharacterized protein n=1 Tax=Flavobacterium phage vB_FspM_pippi8-1 TaxID=2686244 RepID=A0A6B9LFI8_9CAUD|nr:hypothetical protein HWC86_gp44 [Flavobacterium phage vB_FspM_pippi8-1]QHB38608.1 hypothetical protein pippi81_gp044 [Flavobacterium phage vB_FspM_pippi8-1]